MGLDFNLSATVAARVTIQSRDGKGWSLKELARLIAVLEMQRAFLAGDPLEVTVSVSSPRPPRPGTAQFVPALKVNAL